LQRGARTRATAAWFCMLSQTPSPCLVFCECTTLPPPHITLSCCFQQCTQNRAPVAQFRIFGPKPSPASHSMNAPPPLPSPYHMWHPTTSPHHSLPPFTTALLKPSHSCSISHFCPSPCFAFRECTTSPLLPLHMNSPATSPQCRQLWFPTAHPKSSPSGLISNFWSQPLTCLAVHQRTPPPPLPPHANHPAISPHHPQLPFPVVQVRTFGPPPLLERLISFFAFSTLFFFFLL
jgi:hypothetical protein